MDPLTAGTTALGLALGGAQLTIQVFEGVVKGFAYFESASNADQEIQVFKLRLRIEYSRLREWGARSALVSPTVTHQYEKSIGSQGTLVISILNALKSKLRAMRQSELRYVGVAPDDIKEVQAKSNSTGAVEMNDISEPHEAKPGSSTSSDEGTALESIAEQLDDKEWEVYDSILRLPIEARSKKEYRRGFNHMFALAQGSLKIVKQPKRFMWAVKDKEKFSESVDFVKDLIDYLLKTLAHDQMEQVVKDTREIRFAMAAMSKSFDEMLALQQAMQAGHSGLGDDSSSLRTLADPNGTEDPDTIVDLDHAFSSEARFKRMMESVTSFSIQWRKTSTKETVFLTNIELGEMLQTEGRQKGAVGKTKVWVEWKPYSPRPFHLGDGKSEYRPHAEIQGRVDRLGALLSMQDKPAQFCIPPFVGVYDDKAKSRFGFVYTSPKDDGAVDPLGTSLLSRLQGPKAPIEERVTIAKQLAQWLLFLHTVDWLHKGIRSSAVHFFQEDSHDAYVRPYISGFEYSRVVDNGTKTTGPAEGLPWAIYTHPQYLEYSEYGYRKTYDIYSFGVILVELAYWKPIHEVLGLNYSSPARVPLEQCVRVQKRLLDPSEGILRQVESNMGKRYAKATTSCLQGMSAFGLAEDKKQADPLISVLLQQAYIRVVVDALDGIAI